MSLTESHEVFAGISEDAANDLLTAFFSARPRHLQYGSPAFVSATTVSATRVPAIAFPGVPGGIHFHVLFATPVLDFHPDDSGGTSPLPPGFNQFTLRTSIRLTVGCMRRQRGQDDFPDDIPVPPGLTPISTSLDIVARGGPQVSYFGPGNGEIRLRLDEVEIVDIEPESLESVLECLILMMLRAALGNFAVPFDTFSFDAFQLALAQGPEIETDQVQVYGNV